MEIRTEIIHVAGAQQPTEMQVRHTRHGPLMSDIIAVPEVFGADQSFEYGFALQWPTIMDSVPDTTMNAATQIFRAQSYDAFVEIAAAYVAPQQNMVVLENDGGRIGYIAPGKVPVRAAENQIQGWGPSPGWDATYDWTGFIPHAELPQVADPSDGFIITANEDIRPADYPHYITRDWSLPLRADRIRELTVNQDRPLTMADMETALHDQRLNSAALALPAMLAAIDTSELPEDAKVKADQMRQALISWGQDTDYSGDGNLVGPSLFFVWYRNFVYAHFEDRLGVEANSEFANPIPVFVPIPL